MVPIKLIGVMNSYVRGNAKNMSLLKLSFPDSLPLNSVFKGQAAKTKTQRKQKIIQKTKYTGTLLPFFFGFDVKSACVKVFLFGLLTSFTRQPDRVK